MNKWLGTGRLTKDPELAYTTSKIAVCKFTLAVDRRYQKDKEKEADFIRCVAFRGTAEHVSKYYHKGDAIVVEGEIRTGNYDKDGQRHYTTDIIISQVEFPMGKNEKKSDAYEPAAAKESIPADNGEQDEFDDSDDGLPF